MRERLAFNLVISDFKWARRYSQTFLRGKNARSDWYHRRLISRAPDSKRETRVEPAFFAERSRIRLCKNFHPPFLYADVSEHVLSSLDVKIKWPRRRALACGPSFSRPPFSTSSSSSVHPAATSLSLRDIVLGMAFEHQLKIDSPS